MKFLALVVALLSSAVTFDRASRGMAGATGAHHRAVRARAAPPTRSAASLPSNCPKSFQQQFFVENRPGAGGVTASLAVARMEPDGYNFVVSGIATHAIAPVINPNTGYDPVHDFTHVAYFGGPPIVFIVPVGLGREVAAPSSSLMPRVAQRETDLCIARHRHQRPSGGGIFCPEERNCDRTHSLSRRRARRDGCGRGSPALRLHDLDDGRRPDRGRHGGPARGQCAAAACRLPSHSDLQGIRLPRPREHDLVCARWSGAIARATSWRKSIRR